jgi:hypothetical protein
MTMSGLLDDAFFYSTGRRQDEAAGPERDAADTGISGVAADLW